MKEFKSRLLELGRPYTSQVPGFHVSKGEVLGYTHAVAAHLGVTLPEDVFADKSEIVGECIALGAAFAALNNRNCGNRHAVILIIQVLTLYNGLPISDKVSQLLNLLEQALIMSGDVKQGEGSASQES